MSLELVVQSKVSQKEKNKYRILIYMESRLIYILINLYMGFHTHIYVESRKMALMNLLICEVTEGVSPPQQLSHHCVSTSTGTAVGDWVEGVFGNKRREM